MTLVFSSFGTTNGIFACSDIITSRQTEVMQEAIELPMVKKPLFHRVHSHVLSGTTQKSTLIGNTLILWSGHVAVGVAITKLIIEQSDRGLKLVDPAATMTRSGFSKKELIDFGLIYHFLEDGGHVRRYCYNLDQMPSAENTLAADGSGRWNFFDNIQTEPFIGFSDQEALLGEYISRVAFHSIAEYNSLNTLDFLYGGWFEITFANPAAFTKVPYAIKLWLKSGDSLGSGGPLFFGWYSNDNLVVTKLSLSENNEGIHSHQSHFIVRNRALPQRPVEPPSETLTPLFVVNIVLNDGSNNHQVNVSQYNGVDFVLEVSPEGIRSAWTHRLRENLFYGKPSGPSLRMASIDVS